MGGQKPERLSRAFALAVLIGAKGLRPSRGEPRRMTAEAKAGEKPNQGNLFRGSQTISAHPQRTPHNTLRPSNFHKQVIGSRNVIGSRRPHCSAGERPVVQQFGFLKWF